MAVNVILDFPFVRMCIIEVLVGTLFGFLICTLWMGVARFAASVMETVPFNPNDRYRYE